ncbi:epoxide hydrolase family protein [Aspergillus brunneoviolaceus CBS 621.78]|uniref:Alpha/beta-hydrolase n=1 Tax=Aspergillus brunneoviolaceus CBS 621.78 TaxID=1450534 RepID=A0ACD1GKI8_9EURO|nr:alpha/beta-hydrolase [Aspergillus brunneoviolaceus CBS 621.78]RAH49742.1 alpha/beta-hydrolase [Aspergillus brunneoviolaceus CBS 621.78]
MSDIKIKDFKIDIPRGEVDRLQRKLRDTRLPAREIVPSAGDRYGPPFEWAESLLAKWTSDFDWFSVQEELNGYPHYIATIEQVGIHFLHARSEVSNAIPLLLVHGWPGSFYEFSRVWGPLARPADTGDQAFHVVVPSLPGFCWSDWPPRAGWTLQDTARLFDKLMRKLGYSQYMVQCGDWGHFVGRELGARYTDSCKLVHFNFAPSALPEHVEPTEREDAVAARVDDWVENHLGYAVCMRTRPHTIGIALNDNPMGILMWVGEKYIEAADPDKQEQESWHGAILVTASLYYFTGCIMPSMLCYYDNVCHENFAKFNLDPHNHIQAPFGYSSFFWDTEPSSKRAVERTGNLVYYKEHNQGGHFAALESPEDIIQDLRELASQEWRS